MKRLIITLSLMSLGSASIAQNSVIVGEKREPKAHARLEVVNPTGATPGGILLPFVELVATNNPAPLTSEGNATHAHLKGMAVYNTATAGTGETAVTPGIYYNDGAKWVRLGGAASGNFWSLTGNADTDPSKHFVGTTDEQPLKFRANGYHAGELNEGNTFFGIRSIPGKQGSDNTVIGINNLTSITTSGDEGPEDSGTNNVVLGAYNMGSIQGGSNNVAIGRANMELLTTGTHNMAFSTEQAMPALTTGTENIAIGRSAMMGITTGKHNIAIGSYALGGRPDGSSRNISIGHGSGTGILEGNDNILIGTGAAAIIPPQGPASGQINIGYLISGLGADKYMLGRDNRKRVGINLDNKLEKGTVPTETLDVEGTMRVRTLPAAGTANSVNTKTDGTADIDNASPNQPFTATRTVVADAQGVLGTVAGLPGGADFWSLTGNRVAQSGRFIGTTDDFDLIFKRGNIQAGKITKSVANQPGNSSTFIGLESGLSSGDATMAFNTGFGARALHLLGSGMRNTAVGALSLPNLTSGSGNTSIGYESLNKLKNNSDNNTSVGGRALHEITLGSSNTSVGYEALVSLKDGSFNIALGRNTMNTQTRGSSNIAIGRNQNQIKTEGGYQLNIGGLLFGKEMIGEVSSPQGKLGVKTHSPTETFQVEGTTRIKSLPLHGAANSIYTKPDGTANEATGANLDDHSFFPTLPALDQTFTATRTVVADANGVLGTVNGLPALTNTKLFYKLQYMITTFNGDWVKNWDTKIDATKYTLLVTNADFQAKTANVNTAVGLTGGYVAPQEVYTSIDDTTKTWRLNADFNGVTAHSSGDHAWYITVLVVNNSLIDNLGTVNGTANQSSGGGSAPSNPIP